MLRKWARGKQQSHDSNPDPFGAKAHVSITRALPSLFEYFSLLTSCGAWPGPFLCEPWFSHLQTGAKQTASGAFHQGFDDVRKLPGPQCHVEEGDDDDHEGGGTE